MDFNNNKRVIEEQSFPLWKALLDVCEGLGNGTINLGDSSKTSIATKKEDNSKEQEKDHHHHKYNLVAEIKKFSRTTFVVKKNPRDVIEKALNGHGVRMIIEKSLYASDTSKTQNRLSMPIRRLRNSDKEFLSSSERFETERRETGNKKKILGLRVTLFDIRNLRRRKVCLKKWNLESIQSYILCDGWFKFVVENGLKKGQVVQVWFFRDCHEKPCFALVKL